MERRNFLKAVAALLPCSLALTPAPSPAKSTADEVQVMGGVKYLDSYESYKDNDSKAEALKRLNKSIQEVKEAFESMNGSCKEARDALMELAPLFIGVAAVTSQPNINNDVFNGHDCWNYMDPDFSYPLERGVLSGDILPIQKLPQGAGPEFPIDFRWPKDKE